MEAKDDGDDGAGWWLLGCDGYWLAVARQWSCWQEVMEQWSSHVPGAGDIALEVECPEEAVEAPPAREWQPDDVN